MGNFERKSGKSMFPRVVLLVVSLVFLLSIAPATRAQIYYGSVNGTVTDSTGAVISGASVVITNLDTGKSYEATTSDSGVYTASQLPVGTYTVKVTQTGFKEFVSTRVEVHVSTNTQVDAKLEVGATTESITVEASNVQVQTISAAAGEVVEGQQVRELPLNGENFMQLVTLSPGVSTAQDFNGRDKGLTGGSDFSVNGNPYTNNLFLVDGVNNVDMGSGRTILVYPSTDAIAEFKMIRNSYGPEYGQASGAIISITTKAGGNQFHGGLFYAGRNDALNANDWFSNFNGTGKAELRRNDWGYHVSGPVLKNKLFFYWNQEWNREIRGQSVTACVPTAAEKAGDFSQGVGCGATAPNIPAELQGDNPLTIANPDPAGLLLAQFYPDPNHTPSAGSNNNWASAENAKTNWSEWNIRADYDISKANRVTFRYTNDSWESPAPNPNLFWGDTFFPTLQSDWSQPSKSVMAKLTTQIGSSMVNDFEFGYGHNAIVTGLTPSSADYVAAVNAAIPTSWPSSLKQTGAYINGGGAWGGLQPYGNGQTMWTIAPYGNHEDLYALQDNVSKVQGNHVWKFGAYWSTNAKVENNNGGADQPAFPAGDGSVSIPTTNQLANILIPGQLFTSNENSINPNDHRIWHDFEWYVGDTWKIHRNLTLTYGIRWSFFREPYSENDAQASFSLAAWSRDEAIANPTDACNGVIIVPNTNPCGDAKAQLSALGVNLPLSAGTPGPNRALVNNANHNIAPRVGIAWDIFGDGKTALRVGAGQYFQRELIGIGRTLSQTAPFVINATSVRSLDSAAPLANPQVSPNAAKDPSGITPNSWQWNVSVERELFRNTTLNVGYVGNSGVHLTSQADLNRVPEENWLQGAFSNGAGLNALRPAFNFGTIGMFARGGHATYHSLQALFRSQLGNYSTFQLAYTYSHSLGDVELDNSSGSVNQEAFVDPSRTYLDKGNTNINRPHIFVANEVFYLPKLTNKSALVRGTLGGWQLNSIITITSGASLSVFSNGASGYSSCSTADQENGTCVIGSSSLNSLTGTGFGNNQRANRGSVDCDSDQSGRQILNPNAFSLTGFVLGTIGDAGRGICTGPTTRNFDVQIAKNWYFKERYRIKFAIDFFNMFNHANFKGSSLEGTGFSASNLICGSLVPASGETVAHYNPCSTTNNVVTTQVGNPNSNFGQVTAVQPGRELQYSLRLYF